MKEKKLGITIQIASRNFAAIFRFKLRGKVKNYPHFGFSNLFTQK
jgi:hypothetical protein